MPELRRLESNLFHLMTVKGKKEFLKKLCLMLKKGDNVSISRSI